MDYESIKRLGLEYIKDIDAETSDEIYDPFNNNHTILLQLKKLNVFLYFFICFYK